MVLKTFRFVSRFIIIFSHYMLCSMFVRKGSIFCDCKHFFFIQWQTQNTSDNAIKRYKPLDHTSYRFAFAFYCFIFEFIFYFNESYSFFGCFLYKKNFNFDMNIEWDDMCLLSGWIRRFLVPQIKMNYWMVAQNI